ncbi:hypothetical protein BD779DRAFT_1436137 [Infundibulicybe gibba]|nr:hypothetical protein BD779DRAFT_1436137 [Infundibulicybe gibba]
MNNPLKAQPESNPILSRHPILSFDDGNIAILADNSYFLVHQGLLSRHSQPLSLAIQALDSNCSHVEGRPILHLQDTSKDAFYFLQALYDGLSFLKSHKEDFYIFSSILRLSTKYEVAHLRAGIIHGMHDVWPSTLAQWEVREAKATASDGVYDPRQSTPHPILVINVARVANALSLLPAAFYDLSRYAPSDISAGYTCPQTMEHHQLEPEDLMNLLRGREHGSRFLSTFIVNELEGRQPSAACIYQGDLNLSRRRNCQAAFEAITFELLRDVNGVVCHRSSDPLFAIAEADLMQSPNQASVRRSSLFRVCEYCRLEFSAVVDAAREEFWQRLPLWFNIDPQVWA